MRIVYENLGNGVSGTKTRIYKSDSGMKFEVQWAHHPSSSSCGFNHDCKVAVFGNEGWKNLVDNRELNFEESGYDNWTRMSDEWKENYGRDCFTNDEFEEICARFVDYVQVLG
jgi:hypothetical protein